jgi:L-asparaginase
MKLIIHGGFFSESGTNSEIKIAKQASLTNIVTLAYAFLKNNTALDTAIYATELLENDPLFNAGTGSQIQSDGKIRLSASLMDGQTGKFAGLINIQAIKNPIALCKTLLNTADRVLSGQEALNFATSKNIPYYNPEIPQRKAEYEAKLLKANGLGTVGCVALDAAGNLAAATSTGGKGFETPGRVSDSATVAGNYANAYAGVSCTGVGEDIVSAALACKIVTRVTDGFSLKDASNKSFTELRTIDGFAGIIGISAEGEMYHCCSHPYMVWAAHNGTVQSCFS